VALNAVWEHVFGCKMKYPRPRYREPIIIDPRGFSWLYKADAPQIYHKFLGAFSERGLWIEMLRIPDKEQWDSCDAEARRILVVLSGEVLLAIGRLAA